jgi:hypothetical protein
MTHVDVSISIWHAHLLLLGFHFSLATECFFVLAFTMMYLLLLLLLLLLLSLVLLDGETLRLIVK